MSERETLNAQIEAKKKETSRKIALCMICGSNENVYVCEQGHEKLFCKACLKETVQITPQRIDFKAKCTPRGNCNYNPLIPQGNGGIASNPYG